MSDRLSRRMLLAGLLGASASSVLAAPLERSLRPVARPKQIVRLEPRTNPYADIVKAANLGGQVGFAVADAKTGAFLAFDDAQTMLPPASVTKALTAAYALDALGPKHQFKTQLLATGPVENGKINGDLVLQGGGDPTLDTDALGDLVAKLKEAGIFEVTGEFRIYSGALPLLPWIDADQPDHVGYNPAISGLNLNFNRVHFEWKRAQKGYDVTMEARSRRFRPGVTIAQMEITEDRRYPVYTYEQAGSVERWTVAKGALGREGARWLPVRQPHSYCAEVFQTLARSHGIALKRGDDLTAPIEGQVLAEHVSSDMATLLKGMLKYSTNLTAEAVGLAATGAGGKEYATLEQSAEAMNDWISSQLGGRRVAFVDHSGLGYDSRISPVDMTKALSNARDVKPLMKPFNLGDLTPKGASVQAKTGTLNYVSALAGFLTTGSGRELVFAIFTADTVRRDAIPPEQRERPPGARSWSRRSRSLQKTLLARWARDFRNA